MELELGVCFYHTDSSSFTNRRVLYYFGYRSCFSGPAEPSVSNCAPSSKDKKAKDDAFEGPDSSEVEDLQPGDRTTLLILSSGGNSTG